MNAAVTVASASSQMTWCWIGDREKPRKGRLKMKARLLGALIAASIAAPALADPPPWAPAHGKRAKDARETWYADRYYRDGRSYKARRLSHDDRIYRGRDGRYYCNRDAGTTGLIIGAVGGGGLGNKIGRAAGGGRGWTKL